MVPDLRLTGGWTWIVFALGAGIIAVGGVLLSPSADQLCETAAASPADRPLSNSSPHTADASACSVEAEPLASATKPAANRPMPMPV
jgi:hypothetical protein